MASRTASLVAKYKPRARTAREVVSLVETARSTLRLVTLPVDAIVANPRNPRSAFAEQAINDLASSLREDGQLQPILVRTVSAPPENTGQVAPTYELIAGERRWRPARRAGLETIQAAVWDVSDEESLRLALIENWHRQNLTPAEEVAGLETLAEAAGNVGVRELARRLRVAPSTISERLRVRRDPIVWPALEAGELAIGFAFRLRRAPSATRAYLVERVLRDRPNRETLDTWIEEVRAEQKRANTGVALTVARLEDRGSVRQSNTSPQAAAGDAYLTSLAHGLDADGRAIALQVYTRLGELLNLVGQE